MKRANRGAATGLSTSTSGVPAGTPHASPAGNAHTHVVNPPDTSTPLSLQGAEQEAAHRRLDVLASEHAAFLRSLRPYPWKVEAP